MLTSRRSVYDALCGDYPIYGLLKEIVDSPDNHVFRIGAHGREFITEMEAVLGDQIAKAVSSDEPTEVHRVGGRQGICTEEGN